jgi:two-component system OmpR family response regulator
MAGRILVVDDQEDILMTTALVLRKGGHEVATASNGVEAIEVARSLEPDLILMDIEMPRMDGWEALRLLRLEENTRTIPVAMFTILFDLKEKVRALKYGAQDYITKPFSMDEMLARVDRILGGVSADGVGAR